MRGRLSVNGDDNEKYSITHNITKPLNSVVFQQNLSPSSNHFKQMERF